MRGVAPAVARARSTATGTGCCAAPRTLSLLWVVGELVILFMVFRYRLYGRYLLNEKGRGRSVVVPLKWLSPVVEVTTGGIFHIRKFNIIK